MSTLQEQIAGLSPEKRARLQELLLRKSREPRGDAAVSAERRPLRPRPDPAAPAPLSFAQRRLWFLEQLEPGGAHYNVPLALRLRGRLDVAALRRSFAEILERHEVLRSSLHAEDGVGEPWQRVEPAGAPECPLVDLAGLEEEARGPEARRLAAELSRRPFDLRYGPLARFALLRLTPGEHLALVDLHHIASDGWSVGLLVREMGALYEAFQAGRPSPLPPLPIQYADFALWQRQELSGEVLERELALWRSRLEGAPRVLELPADRPRSPRHREVGAVERFTLPGGLVEGVRSRARDQGATLFMALLAAFAALLSRASGREDLIVGTPVAGRNRTEVEGLIGFFVNLLPLRIELWNDPGFLDLLGRVRDRALEAYAHQELPFELLVERLEVHRDLNRSPLIQVLFALQNAPDERLALPGLEARAEPLDTGTAKYELSLSLFEDGGALAAAVEFDAALFDRATIRRFAGHFQACLEEAVAAPESRLSALLALSPGERHQLLVEWNDTLRPPDVDEAASEAEAVHRLVERWARATPGAPAVVCDGRVLSYGLLNAWANRLARRLRAQGAGVEVPVAVYLERSPGAVVAALAVLKAGGVYLPLDPEHARERLAFVLEDADAPLLLTRRSLATDLALRPRTRLLDLEEEEVSARDESGEDLPREAGGENLAYVIYTSGSTGVPKGVAVPHRALANLLRSVQRLRGLTPADAMLQRAARGFDVYVSEIFWPLTAGARVVIAQPGLQMDPAYLVRLIAEERVTAGDFVPSLLRLMLEEPRIEECADLAYLVVGAEAMPPDLPAKLAARLPWAVVENHYGPTEATVDALVWRSDGREPEGAVPIGRPLPNLQAYVLGHGGTLVPIGAPGEIHLGGRGLARAYLGRPDLTAERFVPDPFGGISGTPGGRLYRTGDLGRHRPDGLVEYLGRIDHQVKVRGYRIELSELETVLGAASGVTACAVAARPDGAGSNRLVAYVAGEREGDEEVARLRRHLRERLPEYMLPSLFVLSRALPMTASGKVDRKALPDPFERLRDLQGEDDTGAALRTPTEELVAAAWMEVLGVGRVAADRNFFELGGHSLLAVQVVSRLRRALGVDLAVREVFEAPTVASLAARVDAALLRARGREIPPLEVIPRDAPLPLSFAQERLWFLDRLEPGNPVYNVPAAVRLRGKLSPAVLRRSLEEIARRHEVLRTVFREEPGAGPRAHTDEARFPMPVVDLAGLPADTALSEARRSLLADARTPFDLERGPLARALLLDLGREEWRLLIHLHHIVTDGWSTGVLIREALTLYEAFAAGEPSPLAPPAIQYADYAAWQRRWLSDEVLAEDLAYFRESLEGAPRLLELPTDRPRPAFLSSRGAVRPLVFPLPWIEAVEGAARRWGATLFMTLLAGFQALAGRLSGQEEIVVGTPVAGRTRPELEGLIGFFVNTLTLRASLRGDPGFRELVGRTREAALGAYGHQELPFERLVEELRPERTFDRTPLFQAMLVLQNTPVPELRAAGLELTPEDLEQGTAKFDLTVAVQRTGRGLEGVFEYRTGLFDAATIERWIAAWGRVLEAAAEADGTRISELPLLGGMERQQLLREWGWRRSPYPRDATVAELFSEQAALRPEAVAVEAAGIRWTYRELEDRSDRLGRHLRDLGVGPEVKVAFCLERSAEAIWAILGIVKAGGAYVPVDPAYPAERQEMLLTDSEARVVLTRPGRLKAGAPAGVQLVDMEEVESRLNRLPGGPLEPLGWAESLVYVIYTSGSTGRPKGVSVVHRGVVRLVREAGYAEMGPEQSWLQLTSLSFDVSTMEIWGALLNGGRLVVPPAELPSVEQVGEWVRSWGVTSLWLTSGLFHQVAEGDLAPLAGLRQLIAGGDVLSPPHVLRALEQLPGCVVVNGYGPTEVTTFTCCHRMYSPRDAASPVPIGHPLDQGWVVVVDRWGGLAPVGVPGELLAGGDGLARGYQGQPDRTAERFVPDPFGGSGERLYRTGDLARWRRDGAVEFLGRIDKQVKIRGFRIEPGEIETALARLPGVGSCAVLVREDGPGRRLVAYLTGDGDTTGVREALRRRLPEFMVPSEFRWLERLPLTLNGKVDYRDLASRPSEAAASGEEVLLPRTPVEELIAGIWADVLALERVGRDRSFFDLGGHSLLATRVVSRLRAELGVEVEIRALFEAPTVAGLAERVEAARAAARGLAAPPLERVPRTGGAPPSYAQERLWIFEQLNPGTDVFHVPFAARITGELDPGLLRTVLGVVAARQEALRTVFAVEGGRVVQRVLPAPEVLLPVIDLTGLAPEDRERETLRIRRAEAVRTFDLERGPLFRAALLALDGGNRILLLTFHHIVFDGWSISLLVRELKAAYGALREGRPPALPALPVQMADYAGWQRQWLRGEVLERKLDSWRRRLAGVPAALELPVDRPRPPVQTYRGATVELEVPEDLTGALRELSRREGTTLFMTVLAALDLLLHGVTGQRDLVVGTPLAGRNRAETEGLIGFFVNMLPVRCRLEEALPFREILKRVRESVLAAYDDQDVPFDRIVEALQMRRDPSRSPLFQVVLAWQNTPAADLAAGGLGFEMLSHPVEVVRYDLHFNVVEDRGRLVVTLTYNVDLFDRETAGGWLGDLGRLLRSVAQRPEAPVAELVEPSHRQRRQPVMEKDKLAAMSRKKFLDVKPKTVAVPDRELVRTRALDGGLPLAVEPAVAGVDLLSWARENAGWLSERLAGHGGLLFRGFDASLEGFRDFVRAVAPDTLHYNEPSTPRTQMAGQVYTSTEYPPEQEIRLHNELSYALSWPMKIFFYCKIAAKERGETPIADSRKIYRSMDPEVLRRFAEKKVMYVRNFGAGFGLPWQTVFKTEDPRQVEAHCREHGIDFTWGDNGFLRTRQVRPAVARHPRTGEMVWFNQANVHHVANLPPSVREPLLAVVEDKNYPLDMNACYGDGSPIGLDDLEAVNRAHEAHTVSFPWQEGDILMLDNMLVSHGRAPFVGPRSIAVMMAEPVTDRDLASPVLHG